MSTLRHRLRAWLVRHLYSYLAAIVGVAGLLTVVFARDELAAAMAHFDPRWVAPILGLTLLNYLLRFLKWHAMLRAVGVRIPWQSSARIFLACFSMIVTPFRLGEAYKLVFLKRLHGAAVLQTGPVLVLERLTDAAAIVALALWRLDQAWGLPILSGLCIVALGVLGAFGAGERTRRILLAVAGRLPLLRRRVPAVEEALRHNSALLRPRILGPVLGLSVLAWWFECVGLDLVLRGLASPISISDSTWVYALATGLGNLTFLPGGLGGTEASLVYSLRGLGVGQDAAIAATMLVRVATLWFAVLIGLLVTAVARKSLHWSEVQHEAEHFEEEKTVSSDSP